MQRIPTYREILTLAAPMMIGSMSESISSIVDTAFMGQLGTLEMDGMGMANIYIMLIITIGWAMARGVQILVAQNYGAENDENIADIMFNILVVILPIGLLLMVALYFFSEDFLKLVITNPDICKIASDICKIRAIGMPLILLISVYGSFYTGISDTKILIYSQGLAAILNIFFNYCLVFGHFGFPEWGYKGSATATVISEVIGLGILLAYFFIKSDILKKYKLFTIRKIRKSILSNMWELSYPLLIQYSFSLGAWVIFFTLIEKMGEKELAISLIVKQLMAIMMVPLFRVADACNTLVGKMVGERNIDLIPKTISKVIKFNLIIMLFFTIFTYIFRVELVSIFTIDKYVIENISGPILILLSSMLFMAIGSVIFNGVAALGNTKISLYIESIVIVLYLTYLYLVMVIRKATLVEAWCSEVLYWILMITFTLLYFRVMDWKKKVVYLDK